MKSRKGYRGDYIVFMLHCIMYLFYIREGGEPRERGGRRGEEREERQGEG